MLNKIKNISAIAFGCLVFLTFAFSAQAQTETKVNFPKGKTTVSFRGKLPNQFADYNAYVFRARKGQTLSFELTTEDEDAFVIVYEIRQLGPAEDRLTPEGARSRRWSSVLPLTSEYSVQVYGTDDFDKKGSGKPYTLRIAIAGK